ncbi:hypothetical protein BOX37_15730 [Nocardia mangyaensis]|uniref:Uncharacterized protein n=1 Tax=Nocardia mangyaensis TaxID=2213200 RepID=A0A1J0VSZ7_9NOCA|nr:hypothetical protein [Nocardia mangyaensis]APE35158.1 hypothetical protein BOX37_15730 [Nocardia mangyaensis]
MAAVGRELRPDPDHDPDHDPLDAAMSAYALVSGALELVAVWMRGEFDTARDQLTDLIARQLLQAAEYPRPGGFASRPGDPFPPAAVED